MSQSAEISRQQNAESSADFSRGQEVAEIKSIFDIPRFQELPADKQQDYLDIFPPGTPISTKKMEKLTVLIQEDLKVLHGSYAVVNAASSATAALDNGDMSAAVDVTKEVAQKADNVGGEVARAARPLTSIADEMTYVAAQAATEEATQPQVDERDPTKPKIVRAQAVDRVAAPLPTTPEHFDYADKQHATEVSAFLQQFAGHERYIDDALPPTEQLKLFTAIAGVGGTREEQFARAKMYLEALTGTKDANNTDRSLREALLVRDFIDRDGAVNVALVERTRPAVLALADGRQQNTRRTSGQLAALQMEIPAAVPTATVREVA